MEQEFLEIGQIVNTFGVKGMVKIVPFTDDVQRFEELKTIYIENKKGRKQYEIEDIKYHKNLVMIKLKGVDDMNQAELLKDSYLKIDRKDAKELEDNSYYIVDLIGLEVYSDNDELLGKLEDVFNTGSNDIYVVKDELGKQILLPAIKDVIKNVDIKNKKIIVHLIEGLI